MEKNHDSSRIEPGMACFPGGKLAGWLVFKNPRLGRDYNMGTLNPSQTYDDSHSSEMVRLLSNLTSNRDEVTLILHV